MKCNTAAALLLAGLACNPAGATVNTHQFGTATAPSENSCLASTATTNGDDCSYNASNPGGAGSSQWIGPTFSAGYYPSGYYKPAGVVTPIFTDPAIPSPVTAPAPMLPLGGKQGIPAGVQLVIDDNGTADPTDDVISGSVALGAFERNVALGDGTRAVESFANLRFVLVGRQVDQATPNGNGGYTYVIGSQSVPQPLTGSGGGSNDPFPSEVASQSSSSALDVRYWSVAGAAGIATFEGNTGATTDPSRLSAGGVSCRVGQAGCPASPLLWSSQPSANLKQASPSNILIRLDTDGTGAITGGNVVVVWEFDQSGLTATPDSWTATTISLPSDASTTLTTRTVDTGSLPPDGAGGVVISLLNETFFTLGPPVVQVQLNQPTYGTVTFANGVFVYTPGTLPVGVHPADHFTYTINNPGGSGPATATITLNTVKAVNDTATATSGIPKVIDVLANDTVIADSITITIPIQPANGVLVVNPDNTITYTPGATYSGSDTFRYQVADSSGGKTVADVTITVTNPNLISGIHQIAAVTAGAENSCLASTATTSKEDCSYNQSNPGLASPGNWIGPTFSAGYYAPPPAVAPQVYADPAVPSPVTAPAPVLPTGGKTGIPAAVRLTVDTSTSPPTIGGNIALGAFQRNLSLGDGTRAIETYSHLNFSLVPRKATSATFNAGTGGYDYVIASSPQGIPPLLSGTTTASGRFSDPFPSQVASQASGNTLDVPYWGAPGSAGIASFEGNTGAATTFTAFAGPDVDGAPSCVTSANVASGSNCPFNPTIWQISRNPQPTNVLLRISTDAGGAITGGTMILVWEFNQSSVSASTPDSWQATTITLGPDGTTHLADKTEEISTLPVESNGVIDIALANDTFFVRTAQSVQITSEPRGSVSYVNGVFQYQPLSTDAGIATVPDRFTYQITDASGMASTATVTISGMRAIDDRATTASGVPITVRVLDNDILFASSIFANSAIVTLPIAPRSGTAVVNADKTITFTPNADFVGCDPGTDPVNCVNPTRSAAVFQYQILSPAGTKSIANVRVNVFPPGERKSGSSAMDPLALLLLLLSPALRRKRLCQIAEDETRE